MQIKRVITFFVNKGVNKIPLENLIRDLHVNEVLLDPSDQKIKSEIIDYVITLDMVEKYEDGHIVLTNSTNIDNRDDGSGDEESSEKVSDMAASQAAKSFS